MAGRARSELVAVAFIKTMTGIAANGMVSTQLPEDNSSWAASGFIKCGPVVGGTPNMYVPMREPIIQINTYAVNPNTKFPDWGKAEELANLIVAGTYNETLLQTALTLRSGINNAIVTSAQAMTEPSRLEESPASYATYTLDLRLVWKEVTP